MTHNDVRAENASAIRVATSRQIFEMGLLMGSFVVTGVCEPLSLSAALEQRMNVIRGAFESGCCLSAALCACVVAGLLSGCALNGNGGTGQPSGNTATTLLITADNNAQIPILHLNLTSVTLVKADGTSVPLLTSAQTVELGSLNGVARPLVTTTVPQGTYTSVAIGYGPSTFVVIDQSAGPGTTEIGNYRFAAAAIQPVKTELTAALNVTGSAMGVLLNLNVPKSLTYTPFMNGSSSTMQPGGGDTNFTPVISLTPMRIAAQPSTMEDGMVEDVHGKVTASSAGELTMTSEDGVALSFGTSSGTVFAGTSGTAAPAVGSDVDVDAALQADGTMLATRVQTEGTQQYEMVGELGEYHSQFPYITTTAREQQGPSLPNGTGFNYDPLQLGGAPQFAIAWPNGKAPIGLPFTPVFDASSIATGQNVATPLAALQTVSPGYPVVNMLTLEPQTIDATVTDVSTANGLTTYQVRLFPNDLTAILGTAVDVTVYATAATHTIATAPLTSGGVGRFRGLLFNDGGMLRMVASEVEDGVPGS